MQWTVRGLDRITGVEKTINVNADTERDAVIAAGDQGMVVEKMTKIEAPAPVANPPPKPAIRAVGVPEMPYSPSGFTVLAAMFYFVGIVAMFMSLPGLMIEEWRSRFQSDNAIGATANALERMESGPWLIVGSVLICAAVIANCAGYLSRIADELKKQRTTKK